MKKAYSAIGNHRFIGCNRRAFHCLLTLAREHVVQDDVVVANLILYCGSNKPFYVRACSTK